MKCEIRICVPFIPCGVLHAHACAMSFERGVARLVENTLYLLTGTGCNRAQPPKRHEEMIIWNLEFHLHINRGVLCSYERILLLKLPHSWSISKNTFVYLLKSCIYTVANVHMGRTREINTIRTSEFFHPAYNDQTKKKMK